MSLQLKFSPVFLIKRHLLCDITTWVLVQTRNSGYTGSTFSSASFCIIPYKCSNSRSSFIHSCRSSARQPLNPRKLWPGWRLTYFLLLDPVLPSPGLSSLYYSTAAFFQELSAGMPEPCADNGCVRWKYK